ncbi:metal ABC transporter solute-binding protein, Zn/Mn family [Hydrogenimonas sp.]
MRGWVLALLLALSPLLAKVEVAVSIVPERYFVERIAGDLAEVTVMVPPGASPATYEPKPSQMRALSRAALYLAIGVPFERSWLPRFHAQNPAMRIVDVTRGIRKVPMAGHHHHGEVEHGQAHRALDPHVWLSPPLAKTIARNIADALIAADPAHEAAYEKGLKRLLATIEATHRKLQAILTPCRGAAMMVFHPSWGYFARTYGLKQIPIEIEGKEPKAKELVHLMKEARANGVTTIFIQPQFARRAAETIARQIGAKVLVADPMAEDWPSNLMGLAEKICKSRR